MLLWWTAPVVGGLAGVKAERGVGVSLLVLLLSGLFVQKKTKNRVRCELFQVCNTRPALPLCLV